MEEIVGLLIFDSWTSALPKLRGAQEERHLIYEGSGLLLDLLLKPAADGGSIDVGGQLLPKNGSDRRVSHVAVTLQSGSVQARTHTNALGEFSFRQEQATGPFNISIMFGTSCFVIRGLDSTAPREWLVESSFKAPRGVQ